MLAAERDTTLNSLAVEAFNGLLQKRGKRSCGEEPTSRLVPRRSDFDWLRAGHSSSGSRPGSTRSSMLRAARGCLLMKPSRSSVSTIW